MDPFAGSSLTLVLIMIALGLVFALVLPTQRPPTVIYVQPEPYNGNYGAFGCLFLIVLMGVLALILVRLAA